MNDIPNKLKTLIMNKIQETRYRFLLRFKPRIILDQKWKNAFGYPIDWEHPRDINEIIQYLLVYTDTSLWSKLADKFLVRNYVKKCGLEDLLIPLYGVWKSANDIDFDALPDKFVLKCNHDSGSTRVIDKQGDPNFQEITAFYASRVKMDFGYKGELHYRRIKPRILAEKYLDGDAKHAFPVDYKVWCFNGVPHHILACYGRTSQEVFINVYDLNWVCHPEYTVEDHHIKIGDGSLPKPTCLPYMLNAAAKLSHGFPEVRVDFYEIKGSLFFGEMTFTIMFGRMKYYTPEYLQEMGAQVLL